MSQDHVVKFAAALDGVLRSPLIAQQYAELVRELVALRERGGRLFVLGVGGGAANAAHAVNDLRKLCGIEAYAPTDGIAELTARANDEGWHTIFVEWLRTSRLSRRDAIMVFSVGGGQAKVSACLYEAVQFAKWLDAKVLGIVGRADGATAKMGDAVIVVGPVLDDDSMITPITETVQIALLHALVSDPKLQCRRTKW